MFWGPIEPIYFAYQVPQGVDLVPGSAEAIQFAMNKSFMHWAFTPYALYTLCGLSIAYAIYNMKMPNTVSSGMTLLYGEKFLKEAIDSTLAQTYENIEIIVVNNGSTDSTKKILDDINAYLR